VTAPDRAPAPPLGESDLAAIEQRARNRRVVHGGVNAYEARLPPDETVLALVAALRGLRQAVRDALAEMPNSFYRRDLMRALGDDDGQ
jgi:hypothetical protein